MKKEQVKVTASRLKEIREACGVRVAELADTCGIRRQTVYAIEDGTYIPNTVIAIRLARALHSSVEELFPLEDSPDLRLAEAELLIDSSNEPWEEQLVEVCERNGKLLAIPVQPQSGFLPAADGVLQQRDRQATVKLTSQTHENQRMPVLAGCDPALSILKQQMEAAGLRPLLVACSSQKALELLKQGRVDVAGSHLLDAASGEYNLPIIKAMFRTGEVGVVHFAAWQQGILSRTNTRKSPHGIADLGSGDFEIMNREKGSGTRSLLDDSLKKEGIAAGRVPGYKRIATGHLAAASAVSNGSVDCCIATSSAARCFGLRFLPLRQERFDLAFRRTFADSTTGQILLNVLNRTPLKRELSALAGYETAHTGSRVL